MEGDDFHRPRVGSPRFASVVSFPSRRARVPATPQVDPVSEDFDRLPDPPWFFQSRLVKDSLPYARGVWECTVRPGAFARTWVTGEASWLNPLEMMAISVGLLSVTDRLLVGEAHVAVLTTIWGSLAPYVKYTLAGAVAHPLFDRAGARAASPAPSRWRRLLARAPAACRGHSSCWAGPSAGGM